MQKCKFAGQSLTLLQQRCFLLINNKEHWAAKETFYYCK